MASELKLSKRDRAKWEAMRQRVKDIQTGALGWTHDEESDGELIGLEIIGRWIDALASTFAGGREQEDYNRISRPLFLDRYSSVDKATDEIWRLLEHWRNEDSRKAKVKNAP